MKGFFFSPRHRVETNFEAHPASYPVDTGVYFPRVKRPGREADDSSSAEVKNASKCTSTLPVRLHGVVLS